MIGYAISYEELEALVTQEKPTWMDRAADRTNKFRDQGQYSERSSIWSEIKAVYMRLQGDSKCAYCERKLESETRGSVEQDVEHFRPKGTLKAWQPSSSLRQQGLSLTPVSAETKGYHLLAYHLFNYAASCKPCNSALKRNYFPIAETYNLVGDNPVALTMEERPYLIYPIGNFDQLPETLIRFYGVSPQPVVASSGHNRERALVTIEFFELDNVIKRKNLILERVRIIIALFPQLENLTNSATKEQKRIAETIVNKFQSPQSPHSNCARSFTALHTQSRSQAEQIFHAAVDLLVSAS
ncbi:MAG: hypothetical protein AAFN40_26840 [Cyanobacteria bacterium J06560_6]